MPQAKFTLSQDQIGFLKQHQSLGYPDRSSLVRDALSRLESQLKEKQLQESAELYAQEYMDDSDAQELTESAINEWPE